MINLMQRTQPATVTIGLSGVSAGYLPTSHALLSRTPLMNTALVNTPDTVVFEATRDRGICGEWTAFGNKHRHSQHSRPS